MSIYYSGTFSRSGGVISAIIKQTKLVNLKAVKRVTVKFDPFHPSSGNTRDFLFQLSCPKVLLTNPNCLIKTEVVCDRSAPSIDFQLIPSIQTELNLKNINFNSTNLSTLELLQLLNKHVSVLAPKEEPVNIVKTKSEKKASGGGLAGKRK